MYPLTPFLKDTGKLLFKHALREASFPQKNFTLFRPMFEILGGNLETGKSKNKKISYGIWFTKSLWN